MSVRVEHGDMLQVLGRMVADGERFGATHQHWKRRCPECAHFRPGSAGDRIEQCTNTDAPLYRTSEYMDKATACRLFEERGQ